MPNYVSQKERIYKDGRYYKARGTVAAFQKSSMSKADLENWRLQEDVIAEHEAKVAEREVISASGVSNAELVAEVARLKDLLKDKPTEEKKPAVKAKAPAKAPVKASEDDITGLEDL